MKVECQIRVEQDEYHTALDALNMEAESLQAFTRNPRGLHTKIRNDMDAACSETLTKFFVSPMFEQLPVILEASVDEENEVLEEKVCLHGLHESGLSQVKQEG
ncbi:hypothetical protein [Brevibacillus invocatus]|uniref:hypothetical protein n=1 Tax=Brevibacillus invocatus TaxID=173959 RepID=UPI00203EA306|nr:hypothetical protein [Brevibacillus invocatus]MCM3078403.1 hypothetical protein [Brevibacillus invocatus]MCM3428442.1 hypothetical protein [Brevibacillus invocatus]